MSDRRIWKYNISVLSDTPIQVPIDSRIRHVDFMDNASSDGTVVSLWLEHWTPAELETRTFRVYGTGMRINDNAHHVGTAIDRRRSLVWHVFEVRR